MLRNPVLEQRLTEAEASAVCIVLVTRLGGSYSRLLGIKLAAWIRMNASSGSSRHSSRLAVRAGSALAAYRGLSLLTSSSSSSVNRQRSGAAGGVAHRRRHRYTRRIVATLRLAVESLVNDYDGDVNRLHFFAEDGHDLVNRLRQLGRKVPRRAVSLFLREMRGVWDKAHPGLPASAVEAASSLGIVDAASVDEVADELHTVWERANHGGRSYADFEVALVRLGENYCEMRRCVSCPMGKLCVSRNDEVLR
jgi:hypothetical protein